MSGKDGEHELHPTVKKLEDGISAREAGKSAINLTEAMRRINTMTTQERKDLMNMPIQDTPSKIRKEMGEAWESGKTESHITNLSSQFDDEANAANVKPQRGGEEEEGEEEGEGKKGKKGGFLEFFGLAGGRRRRRRKKSRKKKKSKKRKSRRRSRRRRRRGGGSLYFTSKEVKDGGDVIIVKVKENNDDDRYGVQMKDLGEYKCVKSEKSGGRKRRRKSRKSKRKSRRKSKKRKSRRRSRRRRR